MKILIVAAALAVPVHVLSRLVQIIHITSLFTVSRGPSHQLASTLMLLLQIVEGETRLKQQQNLYEAVRADRNLYSKNLIQAQDEIQEMKRKFQIMVRFHAYHTANFSSPKLPTSTLLG